MKERIFRLFFFFVLFLTHFSQIRILRWCLALWHYALPPRAFSRPANFFFVLFAVQAKKLLLLVVFPAQTTTMRVAYANLLTVENKHSFICVRVCATLISVRTKISKAAINLSCHRRRHFSGCTAAFAALFAELSTFMYIYAYIWLTAAVVYSCGMQQKSAIFKAVGVWRACVQKADKVTSIFTQQSSEMKF